VRVLSVVHYPVFGGPQNRNMRIAPLLREAGIELTVLLPDEPGDAAEHIRAAGVDVMTMPLDRLRTLRNTVANARMLLRLRRQVSALRALIRQGGFDVVLINGLLNPHAALAAPGGIGVVWQLLDTVPPPVLRRALMQLVIRRSDIVMTAGMEVAAAHPGALELGDRLIAFFPPVDLEAFAPSPERRAAARLELGLEPDDLVVGNVSNLTPVKDHFTFVRAAAQLRRVRPDVRFVILGNVWEHRGDHAQRLLREAASLGLELDRSLIVREPGNRVAELEPAFDVFWLTSVTEGLPTVVGEAMALELPVVSTDVGAVHEAVLDGVTGALVPVSDPEALVAATLPYLDAERGQAAGGEARRRAAELFSLEACAAVHLGAIERAAARARRT
jgi:glycosyltransferase involved in cell wall biosynthesis